MRWRADFIRRLARRDGDLIVIPDLDQIFAKRSSVSQASPAPTSG
jgi:purine-binding chemotaxis protein CheW